MRISIFTKKILLMSFILSFACVLLFYNHKSLTRKIQNEDQADQNIGAEIGARKIMAAAYQSCDVLQKAPYDLNTEIFINRSSGGRAILKHNRDKVIQSHYYLKNRKATNDSSKCQDVNDISYLIPIYGYGSKIEMDENGEYDKIKIPDQVSEINHFYYKKVEGQDDPELLIQKSRMCSGAKDNDDPVGNGVSCNSLPVRAIDCSGFVSASLLASGRRVEAGNDDAYSYYMRAVNYLNFEDVPEKKNRDVKMCFEDVSDSVFEAGDIIAWDTHIVIVNKTSNDPFGIRKIKKPQDCNEKNISASNYDFTIVQSSAAGGGIGINIAKGKQQFYGGSHFKKIAIEACLNKFRETKLPLVSLNNSGEKKMRVIRHLGIKDSDCFTDKKLTIEGEDCTQNCKF